MYDSIKVCGRFLVYFVWVVHFVPPSCSLFFFFFFLSSPILLCIEKLNLYQSRILDDFGCMPSTVASRESYPRSSPPNIILTWTGGGGGKKEEAEAEAEVEEGKKKSGCRLPDALFCGFQTSAYRSCPTSQMRIVELHARTTPKMWERSLACFYPFFFFFFGGAWHGAGHFGCSLVCNNGMYANIFFDVCKTYFWFCMEGIQTRTHTHTHTYTHPPTHTHAHSGTHPSHAALFSQKGRAYS